MTAQELAPRSEIVRPLMTAAAAVKEYEAFEDLKSKLLTSLDYQVISGKPFIKKRGWRKLALVFNISDEIIDEKRVDREDGSFLWEFKVRAVAPNGRFTEAVASCDSRERKFAHTEHDVRATAHTRSKSRAISDLIGAGEVSAEEMEAESSDVEEAPPEQTTTRPPRSESAAYKLAADELAAKSLAKPQELRPFIHTFADPIPVELAEDLKKELDRVMTQYPPSKYAIRPGKSPDELASVYMKDVPLDSIQLVKNNLAEAERKLVGGGE